MRQAESELNLIQRQIVDQMSAGERESSPDAFACLRTADAGCHAWQFAQGLVECSWQQLVIGLMLIACLNLANAQLGRTIAR